MLPLPSARGLTRSPVVDFTSGAGTSSSPGASAGRGSYHSNSGPSASVGIGIGAGRDHYQQYQVGQGRDQFARSPSGLSTLSTSSTSIPPHPGLLRRRSTDTSGGLDYYFSSLAGAGASSSSSSLGVSPSPSAGLVPGPSPAQSMNEPKDHDHSRVNGSSSSSLEHTPRQPEMGDTGQRFARALSIPSPADSSSNLKREKGDLSPGGWSESSRYSNNESAPASAHSNHLPTPYPTHSDSGSSGSAYSPVNYKLPLQVGAFDFEEPGERRGLLDPSVPSVPSRDGDSQRQNDYSHRVDQEDQERWDVRSSVNSASTYKHQFAPSQAQSRAQPDRTSQEEVQRTPMAATSGSGDRPEIRPPQLSLNQNQDFYQHRSSPTLSAGHSTPRHSPKPRSGGSAGSHHFTPATAARAGLGIDPAPSPRSDGAHSSDSAVRSAPAAKSEFTDRELAGYKAGDGQHGDAQARASERNDKRRTLPATTPTSSGAIVEPPSTSSDSRENLLSPDMYVRATTPTHGERRGSTPSPHRSPDPPPKSRLRERNNSRTPRDAETSSTHSHQQITSSPPTIPLSLPTIINTSSSPLPSPERSKAGNGNGSNDSHSTSTSLQPRRPDRSPDRQHSPVFPSSATINDLTDMLGGAIDAIGLIDSRDTPPPTVGEPSKRDKPKMSLSLAPAAELASTSTDREPMTPTSLPTRGASLAGPSLSSASLATTATVPGPQGATNYTHPQSQGYGHARQSTLTDTRSLHHKASSIFSYTDTYQGQAQMQSPITMTVSVRPWPAAMLYGNIKSMKHAGDRAKGYARAINELARSESGLKEWCIAASAQANRPNPPNSKMSAVSSLGVRSNTLPSAIPPSYQLSPYDPTPHQRNVSAGSEFPMRADSYAAREISQRVLDPADQPTSLPSNLPYPQLQVQAQQGYLSSTGGTVGGGAGLKPSQSMQSVASFSSSKKGFFSAIARKGTSKKDSLSLGPPGAYNGIASTGTGASTAKKDVRGLPISGPRSASPQKPEPHGHASTSPGPGAQTHAARVQGSISAPIGPRGPRGGSFTPPPPSAPRERSSIDVPSRASLDTGLSRMGSVSLAAPRGSLDGGAVGYRMSKGPGSESGSGAVSVPISAPMPHRGSSLTTASTPMSASSSGGPGPAQSQSGPGSGGREEEVRRMADILPHVERSTLRTYLVRYGDQMQAIGAYLEDEKSGSVLR